MKKIPTAFERDWEGDRSRVTSESTVELEGATPTAKWDGTAVMLKHGQLYKRYDVKKGRTVPDSFVPAQPQDDVTGHWPGWVPADEKNPADKWLFSVPAPEIDGTYEFCGPKVNGNPHELSEHRYIPHGVVLLDDVPTDFEGLKKYLETLEYEGIVWWHGGAPLAKIKRRDFGYQWPDKKVDTK